MSRPTQAIIDLNALQHNLTILTNIAGNSKVIGVVKADAYGNGAIAVAKAIENKVDMLAVAFIEEALELIIAGINKTILILQGPHKESDLYEEKGRNLIWLLHSSWQLNSYAKYCESVSGEERNSAWLKFDTGMHRLGFPISDFKTIMQSHSKILDSNTVIVTHLACADELIPTHAERQIQSFLNVVEQYGNPMCLANSATNIRFPKARQDYVRLGIALYGSTPFPKNMNQDLALSPVMSLESEVIAIRTIPKGDFVGYGATWQAKRPSKIATVALGYADGYPRHAPSGTPAWCNNQTIHLVGRVSMDMLTFDVTDLADIKIGDKVQLWGDCLSINTVADHIGTIGYELMTRISKRVPKIFKGKC